MTRDEIIFRLSAERKIFDSMLSEVPPDSLDEPVRGSAHSVKQIVAHIAAYEQLIVERLISARHGAKTSLEPDRGGGWDAFNKRTWEEAAPQKPRKVLSHAADVFGALVHEVGQLSDEELRSPVGATAALDPGWLQGQPPWQAIAADSYEHYRQHYPVLEVARAAAHR